MAEKPSDVALAMEREARTLAIAMSRWLSRRKAPDDTGLLALCMLLAATINRDHHGVSERGFHRGLRAMSRFLEQIAVSQRRSLDEVTHG